MIKISYAVFGDINLHTNITSDDVSDANITSLIAIATAQVNRDIQIGITRERVIHIDSTRENMIDGSNTTYYVQEWEGRFIGDKDDNGVVGTSDVVVHQVDSTGTETTLTVSSVTHNEGKFVLSVAPASGVTLYVSYKNSPVDMSTPDNLVKQACIYLTASMCYLKINLGKAPRFRAGNMTVFRHMDSYNQAYDMYLRTLDLIKDNVILKEASHLI